MWEKSNVNPTANKLISIFGSNGKRAAPVTVITSTVPVQLPTSSASLIGQQEPPTNDSSLLIREQQYTTEIIRLREELAVTRERASNRKYIYARAWSIVNDPTMAKAGQYQILKNLLDDLGVFAQDDFEFCTDDQLQLIADHLKPVQSTSFLSCCKAALV